MWNHSRPRRCSTCVGTMRWRKRRCTSASPKRPRHGSAQFPPPRRRQRVLPLMRTAPRVGAQATFGRTKCPKPRQVRPRGDRPRRLARRARHPLSPPRGAAWPSANTGCTHLPSAAQAPPHQAYRRVRGPRPWLLRWRLQANDPMPLPGPLRKTVAARPCLFASATAHLPPQPPCPRCPQRSPRKERRLQAFPPPAAAHQRRGLWARGRQALRLRPEPQIAHAGAAPRGVRDAHASGPRSRRHDCGQCASRPRNAARTTSRWHAASLASM
mmetsp:Transcript_112798/g.318934  ORF Transcript_112798/g.318934 Transcript_112798/m.318934 type:complete len:270 (-) Transcript_112798:1652-2461(-)